MPRKPIGFGPLVVIVAAATVIGTLTPAFLSRSTSRSYCWRSPSIA